MFFCYAVETLTFAANPMIRPLFFIGIFSMAVFAGCSDDRIYENNEFIDHSSWAAKDKKTFEVDIIDTSAFYDVYTNLRITASYPYSNIFLLCFIKDPDGKLERKELIEFTLAEPGGRWLGKGLGDLYDYRILHPKLREITFRKMGKYNIELRQEMRTDQLEGFSSVGIRVVKK